MIFFQHRRFISFIAVAFILSGLLFVPAQTTGTSPDILLKTRILTNDNALSLDQPDIISDSSYFLLEVDTPVQESTYKAINDATIIEGYSYPGLYLVKADVDALQRLGASIKRAWTYTDKTNINPHLSTLVSDAVEVDILLFASADKEQVIRALAEKVSSLQVRDDIIRATLPSSALSTIALIEGVQWIEQTIPVEVMNDAAVKITGAASERADYGIYGENQIITVADSGLDTGVVDSTMHDDFQGRILNLTDVAGCCSTGPDDESGHGTHVAGTVLGSGILSGSNPLLHIYSNSYAGVAPESLLVFQAIGIDTGGSSIAPPALESGLFQPAYNQGSRIHSDSWGGTYEPSFGEYNSNTKIIDKFIWNHKDMNILYAAGNYGSAYGNDTINPYGSGKNSITVGATENYKTIADPPEIADDPNDLALFSSQGPTDDGRIKPDVLAPGTEIFSTRSRVAFDPPDGRCIKNWSNSGSYNLGPNYATCGGTSMSTPHVAGLAALTREYYLNEHHLEAPAELIKATLINSAMDIGYGMPSMISGWGRVNLSKAFPSAEADIFFVDVSPGLVTGAEKNFNIQVAAGTPFKATLVWTDKDGATFASRELVNDLDFVVKDPQGNIYNGNDFQGPFDDSRDNLNNVEQVRIDAPPRGRYTLTVKGRDVPVPSQTFALVVSYKDGRNSDLKRCTTAPPGAQCV